MYAVPYCVYAAIFIAIPLLLVFYYAFTKTGDNGNVTFTLENFSKFFDFDQPYLGSFIKSLKIAFISTAVCLLLGYPMAYILTTLPEKWRNMLSMLFMLPMWMNFLLRTYAWMTLLEDTGVINSLLAAAGLPSLNIMYTESAIVLGTVYNFLPFMILPIYNTLMKIDKPVLEAAGDLGANWFQRMLRVVLPLSVPGVLSGISMVFMPAMTTFVISKLLGDGSLLYGDIIERQFKVTMDWGFGSALSVVLIIIMIVTMGIISKSSSDEKEGGGGGLW